MTRIFRLRVEEVIALVFLVPTTYLTVVAKVYAKRVGARADRHPGGVVGLAVAVAFLLALWAARRWWPDSRYVKGLREVVPLLACILIYTNLHDTIGFVNPHDVHDTLAALDRGLFGA